MRHAMENDVRLSIEGDARTLVPASVASCPRNNTDLIVAAAIIRRAVAVTGGTRGC